VQLAGSSHVSEHGPVDPGQLIAQSCEHVPDASPAPLIVIVQPPAPHENMHVDDSEHAISHEPTSQ
jgi:hypothetical protein